MCYGEMPEWSNGPHSKCGERATVPGVRIPLSPQRPKEQEDVARHLFVFYAYGSSSLVDGGMENKKWAT